MEGEQSIGDEAAALSGLLVVGQGLAALVHQLSKSELLTVELRARCAEEVKAWLAGWERYAKASAPSSVTRSARCPLPADCEPFIVDRRPSPPSERDQTIARVADFLKGREPQSMIDIRRELGLPAMVVREALRHGPFERIGNTRGSKWRRLWRTCGAQP